MINMKNFRNGEAGFSSKNKKMCAVHSDCSILFLRPSARTSPQMSVHDFKRAYMISNERPALFRPIKNRAEWTSQGQCDVINPAMFGCPWWCDKTCLNVCILKDFEPMTSSRSEIPHPRYESFFIFSNRMFFVCFVCFLANLSLMLDGRSFLTCF